MVESSVRLYVIPLTAIEQPSLPAVRVVVLPLQLNLGQAGEGERWARGEGWKTAGEGVGWREGGTRVRWRREEKGRERGAGGEGGGVKGKRMEEGGRMEREGGKRTGEGRGRWDKGEKGAGWREGGKRTGEGGRVEGGEGGGIKAGGVRQDHVWCVFAESAIFSPLTLYGNLNLPFLSVYMQSGGSWC